MLNCLTRVSPFQEDCRYVIEQAALSTSQSVIEPNMSKI